MEQLLIRTLLGRRRAEAEVALRDDQFRAMLSFRFRYIFTFHAPVLLPLLESLAGRMDPSIGMLSLGAASLTMVAAEVPAGVFADRRGPKAALVAGISIMIGVMVVFFFATVMRARLMDPGAAPAYWAPGVVSMFCAEIAIGVALALINGADTVLFIDVARRAGLDTRSIEGVGASIRYLGTMIAVGSGATIYMLAEVLVADPADRLAWQSGLYLLTAVAQVLSLLALRRVNVEVSHLRGWRIKDPSASTAKYYAQTFKAIREIFRRPAFFTVLWIMCGAIACAEFSVYLLQSPLKRFVERLLEQSLVWLPVFTTTMMLGWWACSHGARLYHRLQPLRAATVGHVDAIVLAVFVAPVLALLIAYPTVARMLGNTSQIISSIVLLGLCGLTFVAFQHLRGLGTPWARTILVAHAEEEKLDVPTSMVSVFNAVQRFAHTIFTVLFFAAARLLPAEQLDDDGQIEFGMLLVGFVLAIGFAVGPIVSYAHRARREAAAAEPAPSCTSSLPDAGVASNSVVVIGSFREDLPGLLDFCDALRQAGLEVLHPHHGAIRVRDVDGFVQLDTDTSEDPGEQQRRVFEYIDESAAVILYTPSGRVGSSSAMEVGYALRHGTPVFSSKLVNDPTLGALVKALDGTSPAALKSALAAHSAPQRT
jgi:MFS family permease